MAKFTLHNEIGTYMNDSASTLDAAIEKCNAVKYKCIVFQTYFAKSDWRPWDNKLVEHGREVYRNF